MHIRGELRPSPQRVRGPPPLGKAALASAPARPVTAVARRPPPEGASRPAAHPTTPDSRVPFGGRPPGAATAQLLSRFCSCSRRCDQFIAEVLFSGRITNNRSWSERESGPKSITSTNDEHLPAERRSPLTHRTPFIARSSSAFGHCLLSADQRLAPSTELDEGLDQEGLRRRTKSISFHAPDHEPARTAKCQVVDPAGTSCTHIWASKIQTLRE